MPGWISALPAQGNLHLVLLANQEPAALSPIFNFFLPLNQWADFTHIYPERQAVMVCFIKNPADAVCCKVLNLLSQVRALPGKSALAEAYRVIVARSDPFLWVLAQNGSAASRTQQGNVLIPQSQEHE